MPIHFYRKYRKIYLQITETDIFLVRGSLQLRRYWRKSAVMRVVEHGQVANLPGLREVSFDVNYSV